VFTNRGGKGGSPWGIFEHWWGTPLMVGKASHTARSSSHRGGIKGEHHKPEGEETHLDRGVYNPTVGGPHQWG